MMLVSRKETRKAARDEKKQYKHQSLLQHQKFRKSQTKPKPDNSTNAVLRTCSMKDRAKERTASVEDESDSDFNEGTREVSKSKGNLRNEKARNVNAYDRKVCVMESDSDRENDKLPAVLRRMSKRDQKKGNRKKTKFEEFLDLETKAGTSMEEDLEMEWRLAKKLKLKNGILDDGGDGLDSLFKGISYFHDSYDGLLNGEKVSLRSKKKGKKMEKRSRQEAVLEKDDSEILTVESISFESGSEGDEACAEMETNNEAEIGKSVEKKSKKKKRKGKTKGEGEMDSTLDVKQAKNMSGETNSEFQTDTARVNELQSICKYVAPHMRSRSGNDLQEHLQIRRRVRGLLNRMSEANVESITGEIFSIFQSVSRAIASRIISEEILASCAGGPRGNEQYAAVFAAFVGGMASMVGIDFGARLLESLAKCFEDEYSKEDNLSLRNLSLLLSYLCIFGVCSSDLIYDFLTRLSKRLTEIDVSTILTILQCCGMKLRGDDPAAMKDFIVIVQSRMNELKATSGGAETTTYGRRMEFMLETICDIKNNKKRTKEDSLPHTRVKKWLQKLRVEDITIRGVTWSKLLDPKKKGQWWFSGDASSATEVHKAAGKMDREVNEAQKMLKLAAKQRMNTDTRRAIFCVIMSGEDYIDTFEQLLSMNLQGKQDREIMRVLVECCLQEKMFNKYYTALASKLCSHDKNHKFTLQYCLWDHLKELESMPLMRSMHLAKFVTEMLASFSLSLAVLKVVDLIDATQLTAKRIMHFRMLFEAIFEYPDNVVWNVFTRVAITPELEELRNGMEFFIREYVITFNKGVAKKFKLAKRALNNAEGVLM